MESNEQSELTERKLRKQSYSQLLQKEKIPRNKPNQGCKRPVHGKLEDIEERN